FQLRGEFDYGIPGDVIVEPIVPHCLELIQDANVLIAAQLPGFVVNLFDVRFDPGSLDQLRAVALDALEALAAHPFRQDDDGSGAHAPSHPSAANAVIAGARPDDHVLINVNLTEEQRLGQHRVGGPDLVGAGGKIPPV